jgi:hypothetical protein
MLDWFEGTLDCCDTTKAGELAAVIHLDFLRGLMRTWVYT